MNTRSMSQEMEEVRRFARAERLFSIGVDALRAHLEKAGSEIDKNSQVVQALLLAKSRGINNKNWEIVADDQQIPLPGSTQQGNQAWLEQLLPKLKNLTYPEVRRFGVGDYSPLNESCDRIFMIPFVSDPSFVMVVESNFDALERQVDSIETLSWGLELAQSYVIEHIDKMDAIFHLSEALSLNDSKVALDTATKVIAGAFSADVCTILIQRPIEDGDVEQDSPSHELVLQGAFGPSLKVERHIEKIRYPIRTLEDVAAAADMPAGDVLPQDRPGLTVWTFLSEKGWLMSNSPEQISSHPWHSSRSSGVYIDPGSCMNQLAVTLRVQDKKLGLMKVENKRDKENNVVPFNRLDVLQLLHVASVVSIAIEKEQSEGRASSAESLSIRDTLTDLRNLMFIEGWAASHSEFAVIFFDIDRFKTYNDRFDYEGGDAILKLVAKAMRDVEKRFKDRQTDVVLESCRQHGDEFVFLLHGAPSALAEWAQQIAEGIRSALGVRTELPDSADGHPVPLHGIPISIGVYCPDATAETAPEANSPKPPNPLQLAGKASRVAKEAGGDRIVFWRDIKKLQSRKISVRRVWDNKVVIDVGYSQGVREGFVFNVLHKPLQDDDSFQRVNAWIRTEEIFAKSTVCEVTSQETTISDRDKARLRL